MTPEELEDQHGCEGEQHFREGRFEDALSSFKAALKIAEERQDREAESTWLANCGSAHLAIGENSQARECLDRALKIAVEMERIEDEMQIRTSLAISCFEQRDPEGALENVTPALRIARETGNRKAEAEQLGYLGIACSMMGDYQTAAGHYQDAITIAREAGDASQIGVLTGNLGNNFLGLEEYEQASQQFEGAIRIAREVGDQINEAKWKSGLQAAREHLQRDQDPTFQAKYDYQRAIQSHGAVDPEQALDLWLRAARSCRVARDYLHCGDSLANAGLILNELQRFPEADRRFDEATDAFRAAGSDRRRMGLVLVNRAVSLRDRGEPDQAIEILNEAINLLREVIASKELAYALSTLAGTYLDRQEDEQSRLLLKEAAQIYRDLNLERELAKILIQLGSIATDKDEGEQLLRESTEVSRSARDFDSLAVATMALASHLAEQGNTKQAIVELSDMKAQLMQEASSELTRQHLLLLAALLSDDDRGKEALEVGYELLEIANRDGDLRSAARAFEFICPFYASELRAIRDRMNELQRRTAAEVESHARSLVPETVPLTVETEDEAIQMVRSLMEAGNRAATEGALPEEMAQLEQVLGPEAVRSPTFVMSQIVSARATEFNQVFFSSLVFNVEHALSRGENDRAQALVELARFIASSQSQSLQVASILLTQLVEEDQTEIIHLAPGAKFSPVAGNEKLNRRVAEEAYREAMRHMAAQRFSEAFKLFETALELQQQLGIDTGECLGNLAYCASVMGRFDAAATYAQLSARGFHEKGDKDSEAKALLILGGVQQQAGEFDQAIQTYEDALSAARAAGKHDVEASAISNIGSAWYERGDIRRALALHEEALELKRKYSDASALVSTLCNLASLSRVAGDSNRSGELLAEALGIIEATGNKANMVMFLNNMASVAINEGRSAEAESSLYKAREIAEEISSMPLQVQVLENLVIALRNQGKWSALDEALVAVEELHRESKSEAGLAKLLMLRLDAAMMRGDYKGAIAASTKLLDQFAEQLAPTQMISVLSSLRQCCAMTGRGDEAAKHTEALIRVIDLNTAAGASSTPEVFLLSCQAYARLAAEGEVDEDKAHQLLMAGIELSEREGLVRTALDLREAQASVFRRQGRLRDAIESHKRALELIEHDKDGYFHAVILSNLATALREAGQLQDSFLTFEEAMAMARQVNAYGLQAQILHKAATVAHDLGRRDDVGALLREAVEQARVSGDRTTEIRAMINLAGNLLEMDDAAGAERYVRNILDHDEHLPADVRSEARAVGALALRSQRRYDEAIKLINDAVSLGRASIIDQATCLFYAGLIYSDNDQLDVASEKLGLALQLIGDVVSPLTLKIRQARGHIYQRQGDFLSAESDYTLAVRDLRLLRTHVVHERDSISGLGEFATIPQKLAHVLLRQQRFNEAFAALEEAKSRSFVDRLGLGDLPIPKNVPRDLLEREHQLLDEILQLETKVTHAKSSEERRRVRAEYSAVVNAHDQLLECIAGYSPEYVEWRRGATITFEDVQEILRS